MPQTSFTAGDSASLGAVLLDIGSGADAAINTGYTITLTAALDAASESVSLESGSTVTLAGSAPFIVSAFAVTGAIVTDLNFTGTITLDNGAFDNVALASNGGGTVVAGLYTGAVLGTVGDGGDSAVNSGTIAYGGAFAAVEFNSGTIQNGWNGPVTALISAVAAGVLTQGAGVVQNGGTILASGTTSAAVFMGSGTVDNGQIGDTGARLSGADNGVQITGAGVLVNDGTIIGVASDAVYLGSGTVTNGQIGAVTALIAGGAADNGVWINTGSGAVNNFGTITGGGAAGVLLKGGGTLSNGASTDLTALIAGAANGVLLGAAGSLSNFGIIEGNGPDTARTVTGVFLENGGSVGNAGPAALISGPDWGVIIEGAAGTVGNLGTIEATGTSGLGADLTAGGTVANGLSTGAQALIAGVFDGVRISKGAAGAGASVLNEGTISGAVGVDFASGPTPSAGTLTNDGLIESTTGTSGFAVQFGAGSETLVLRPAGAFIGHVLGDNATGSGTALELAAGTQGTLSGLGNDAGTVSDSAGSFAFSAIGTIQIDAGASWAVNPGGMDTVINAGALAVTEGVVTVGGSLANAGSLAVGNGTLSVTAGVLSDSGVISVGAGGVLKALGGGITAAGTADILVGGGSPAALYVSGAGATVNSGGERVTIGGGPGGGQGSGLIGQGGTLLAGTPFAADEALVIGGAAGASGALTVTDPGSRLTAVGQLSVGLGGGGSLLIQNQATVAAGANAADASEGVDIGQLAGASGQAAVSGAKSLLTNSGRFIVGDAGLGSLSIAAGGAVVTSPGAVGGLAGLVIANTASASGSSVNVSGAGSDLAVTGSVVVGAGGYGSLSLSGGATVTAGVLDAAAAASGDGVVSVVGAGTTLTVSGSLIVGDQSTGEMSILDGAQVTVGGGLIGGAGANGSGNLDVEGNGSQLTIAGGTLVVGASGPAVYTLGQGTTQTGQERTAIFGVANLGGLQDPPYITNDGAANLNSGFVGLADIAVLNSGTYTVKALSGTFAAAAVYAPDITFDSNPADNGGSTTGLWVIQNLGTLVLNASTVDASQTFDFSGTNGAKLILGQTPAVSSSKDVDGAFITTGSIAQGSPNVLAGFAAPIQNYLAGDAIVLQGLSYGSATASGDVVTVWSAPAGGGTALGTLTFIDKGGSGISVAAKTEATLAATQLTTLACFAAGTLIETVDGPVKVEDLRVGDRVVTVVGDGVVAGASDRTVADRMVTGRTVAVAADREALAIGDLVGVRMAPVPARPGDAGRADEPIVWLGARAVHCATHPDPETVWPVRVQAGAFGENVPVRDLYLSPDHAVFINDVLIPVKLLINGTSIMQVERNRVTYHHVELPAHAVILAEGLAVESYLDLGDRANFADGGEAIRLFPDFAAGLAPDAARTWETKAAAPLVLAGEKLAAARAAAAGGTRGGNLRPECQPTDAADRHRPDRMARRY